ncbi:peroxiredoxin [Granulicella aggregans]|uniref:Peroxiredoxin n=1 Tax=Granulicella aggregans TaxID=474949 RepID=A0A7W7ZCH2_9BACT|nr:TlpA disulfide reductase family protein [Granulicella aggregans]MBB5057208.1 peroxiredoxin [Granulicella aggregans]
MLSTRRAILSAGLLVSLSATGVSAGAQASPQTQEKAQNQSAAQAAAKPVYTAAESAIIAEMKTLRSTPDSERGAKTSAIAAEIAALPGSKNKLRLASGLSNLSTEGDFGHQSLQDVANTLTLALTQSPIVPTADKAERPASPYLELAKLVRYEHVTSTLNDPEFERAKSILVADEVEVEKADFTLTDLTGKSWTLSKLRGKVVMVNFWATWCPPCRKEMPDLDTLAHRFAKQGLVVLSLSDEDDHAKVASYISSHNINYPILLDPDGTTAKKFHVEGIPKTFIFDRSGKVAAQSIDMRTQGQFLAMLQQAGIKP